MTTQRQTALLTQLNPVLNGLVNLDIPALAQRDRLGSELSFDNAVPILTDIRSSAERLYKSNLEHVPQNYLKQILDAFTLISNSVELIKNFSPAGHPNAPQQRDALVNRIEDLWGSAYLPIRLVLSDLENDSTKQEADFLSTQLKAALQLSSEVTENLKNKQNELENHFSSFFNEKSEQFAKEGQQKLEQVDQALTEVRKAAGEAGVSQTSVHFNAEAIEHNDAARKWIFAIGAVTAALLLFSLFGGTLLRWAGTAEPSPDSQTILHIKYLTQKGIVMFCLIFGLILTVRNYAAAKHNYVVNKHRNNALRSFQTFVASATDDQTKNAVLIQATQSIFSPQPSGYVRTDGENSPSSPIVEIIRSVGKTKDT